jgi:hypothetical protein
MEYNLLGKMKRTTEFYCFISYKHRDNEAFVADQKWSELIANCLANLYIPTKIPLRDQDFVCLNPKDERVSPVFRDFNILTANDYNQKIEEALQCSRKLVAIVSKEMLADQEHKVKSWLEQAKVEEYEETDIDTSNKQWETVYKQADAWCYREIHQFLHAYHHLPDDVIIVYIGDKEDVRNIIPDPLRRYRTTDKNAEGAIYSAFDYNDTINYWENSRNIFFSADAPGEGINEERAYLIAGRIAGSIFDVSAEEFASIRKYRELARRRKTIIMLLLI